MLERCHLHACSLYLPSLSALLLQEGSAATFDVSPGGDEDSADSDAAGGAGPSRGAKGKGPATDTDLAPDKWLDERIAAMMARGKLTPYSKMQEELILLRELHSDKRKRKRITIAAAKEESNTIRAKIVSEREA